MPRLRLLAILPLAVGLILASAGPASAVSTLDYQQGSGGSFTLINGNQWIASQYPAGITGGLTSVDLNIWRTGTPTNLTISVYAAAGGVPSGAALTSQVLTSAQISAIPTSSGSITVTFTNPAPVTSGSQYFIAATTTSTNPNYFNWDYQVTTGVPSVFSTNQGASWSADVTQLGFATYVDSAWVPPVSPSSGSSGPPSTLTLAAGEGTCEVATLTGAPSTWARVPSPVQCSRTAFTLLGWSTSSAFPLELARRQVAAGWGAIDTYINGSRMIFIPAGDYAALNGSNTLHAVWAPAT